MSQRHEPAPDVPYSRDAIEHALVLWHGGWKQSTRAMLPKDRRAE